MATLQLSMVQTVVQCISHSPVACCLLIVGLLTLCRSGYASVHCGAVLALLLISIVQSSSV